MSILKRTLLLTCCLASISSPVAFAQIQKKFNLAAQLENHQVEFKQRDFHGYQQFSFQLDGIDCKIVQPTSAADGNPWIWRARFWGHEPQLEKALLEKGWFVCYCDVGGLFGSDTAIQRWDRFYDFAQGISLGTKPFLEGMSRGGLIIIRWAAANPKQVSGIYADNAVLDFRSWPGGKGVGKGAANEWRQCLDAYGISERDSESFDAGPLNQLQPLVDAQVPIVALINEADNVVPPVENGDLLVAKYNELGGSINEIRRAGLGHHPHSLKDPTVLVNFAVEAMKKAMERADSEITVRRIWDKSPHNAFTDLIRWNEKFYCTFRTGKRHVHGDEGRIQLLESVDGQTWTSIAHLSEEGIDLRDPKLSITPDNRLMLLFGGSNYVDQKLIDRATRVAFLEVDGKDLSPITRVNIDKSIKSDNDWLWRVTWHKKTGYGIVYQPGGFHLIKTTNGIDYELVKSFDFEGRPNESTIRFSANDQMRIVARNEETGTGHLIISDSPYTEYSWNTIPIRLGGPNMIELTDGTWILATRQYSDPTRTVLGTLADNGAFERLHELPSAGDTSYPGLLIHENRLWVSYYASHEGKTSIYLAKIPLEQLTPIGATEDN